MAGLKKQLISYQTISEILKKQNWMRYGTSLVKKIRNGSEKSLIELPEERLASY